MNTTTASDQVKDWLHLHLTDQVGSTTFQKLIEAFGDAKSALSANAGQLANVKGIGPKKAEKIAMSRDKVDVEKEINLAKKLGITIITRKCESYPAALNKIYDPPSVIYIKGNFIPSDNLAVAIVGSRQCSQYGQEQASRFAHMLAASGFTIVSGLARGIDTAAHRGSISAKGRTLAIQGCGLATIYPPENEPLAKQITNGNGAIISELPLTFEPLSSMFPGRNRIISGLSIGTLVVEARPRSGALITAKIAIEQDREVMAIPGRIDAPASKGTHQLIKEGAQLVESIEDVLDALGQIGDILRTHSKQKTQEKEKQKQQSLFQKQSAPETIKLSESESSIIEIMDLDPIHIDSIAAKTGMNTGNVNANITVLQLKGLVKQLPGSYYQKRKKES